MSAVGTCSWLRHANVSIGKLHTVFKLHSSQGHLAASWTFSEMMSSCLSKLIARTSSPGSALISSERFAGAPSVAALSALITSDPKILRGRRRWIGLLYPEFGCNYSWVNEKSNDALCELPCSLQHCCTYVRTYINWTTPLIWNLPKPKWYALRNTSRL